MNTDSPIALVTGVSSGLGRAIALELARRGYGLGLVARRADRVSQLANELRSQGARAHVLPGDLRDSAFCAGIVDELVAREGRLDLLVNNAGAPTQNKSTIASDDEFDAALALNLRAPFRLAHAAHPPCGNQRAASWRLCASASARRLRARQSAMAAAPT